MIEDVCAYVCGSLTMDAVMGRPANDTIPDHHTIRGAVRPAGHIILTG